MIILIQSDADLEYQKQEEVGTLPANVRTSPYIPFERLLPHVDVMVTNGGYGGTQAALAHGVPLVLAGKDWHGAEVVHRRAEEPDVREHVRFTGYVADEVVRRLSDRVIREIAWEIVPDLAAALIRQRLREIEREDPEDR